jgi:catechol 2,3-dioxygenase-like lactoylglutathione lyase family enzyme
MLTNATVRPTIPVTNLDRAKSFYQSKLGLKPVSNTNGASTPGTMLLDCGNGTIIELFQRSASKADHTLATFDVADIENEVRNLRQNGVSFEDYDMPGIKTQNGIATQGQIKCAWFKDSEGNVVGLWQPAAGQM